MRWLLAGAVSSFFFLAVGIVGIAVALHARSPSESTAELAAGTPDSPTPAATEQAPVEQPREPSAVATSPAAAESIASVDPAELRTLPLYFEAGSANYTVIDQARLDEVLAEYKRELDKAPSSKLEIGGHTSSEGTRAYNELLGRARALEVVRYLIASGLDSERIVVRNYRVLKPRQASAKKANKVQNRRVTLRVVR
jgi:outer membrane protein OmpA-like peptidoglycan-associated protein